MGHFVYLKLLMNIVFTCSFTYSFQNSPQQSANAKAYLFFSICLGKKNAEVIKFLEIFKKICLQE